MEDITDLDRLMSLAPEWSALWEACPDATPFQSPEFLLAWWRRIGVGELRVMGERDAKGLAWLMPCFVYTRPSGARQLTFLGNGVGDQLGALLRPDAAHAGAIDIIDRLSCGAWDCCDLRDMNASSPLVDALRMAEHVRDGVRPDTICPYLPLRPSPEVPPRAMAADLRYARRRAERDGPL